MTTEKIKSAEAHLLKQIKAIEDKYGMTLGVNRSREWDQYRYKNFRLSDDLKIKSNVDKRDKGKYKSFDWKDETWTSKQQELATAGQQVFELKQKLNDIRGNVIDKVRSGISRKTVSGQSRYSLEREQLLINKYPTLFSSNVSQAKKDQAEITNNIKTNEASSDKYTPVKKDIKADELSNKKKKELAIKKQTTLYNDIGYE